VMFVLSVFVDELMRSYIVEVNSLSAYRTSYFGHGLSKDEGIFTNLHFGCLLVVSLWLKSELPRCFWFCPTRTIGRVT